MGKVNLWDAENVPHRGWRCVGRDRRKPGALCEMCNHQRVQKGVYVWHRDYPHVIRVGGPCAAAMTLDSGRGRDGVREDAEAQRRYDAQIQAIKQEAYKTLPHYICIPHDFLAGQEALHLSFFISAALAARLAARQPPHLRWAWRGLVQRVERSEHEVVTHPFRWAAVKPLLHPEDVALLSPIAAQRAVGFDPATYNDDDALDDAADQEDT